MRIRMQLPRVEPNEYIIPAVCPQENCGGSHFKLHQRQCDRAILDPDHNQVNVRRYRCLRCKRTFRVYPQGVSRAQRSDRLRGIGIMLYVLGLSYGGVEDALWALGLPGSKSSTYRDVQEVGEAVKRIRKAQGKRKVQVLGADSTFVICNREQVTIAVGVDALTGQVLDIELVDAESAEALTPFLEELQTFFEVEVLLSDDQDSYKKMAADLGLTHGICRAHVNRNVAKLVGQVGEQALQRPDPVPEQLNVTVDDFIEDLLHFQLIVALRPADGQGQLWQLFQRYRDAPAPSAGGKASMWYRFRLALQRWWSHWSNLTLDQRWRGPGGVKLDGTNNATERAIGWWIKERYRTMRNYKRKSSVLNVSNLICYLGSNSGDVSLATLLTA
jgi:transposase-like protein